MIYIIIFNHNNGTSFLCAVCTDPISLFNKLERLLPDDLVQEMNTEFEKDENFSQLNCQIGNGIYNIYQAKKDVLLQIGI